jgi:type VI secretion system protein ImpM
MSMPGGAGTPNAARMQGAALTAEAGLFGKLPSRGDFVQLGLPGSFVRPWDAWLQQAMAGSRERMGDAWLPAYLESPVWRFVLPGGMCGAGAVLGLLMPSVDRVGRYFPLTLAAVFPPGAGVPADDVAGRWLEVCEDAGRAALDDDVPPGEVARQVAGQVPGHVPLGAGAAAEDFRSGVWWTDGGPRVAATRLVLATMPDAAQFAVMLGAGMLGEGLGAGLDGGAPAREEA